MRKVDNEEKAKTHTESTRANAAQNDIQYLTVACVFSVRFLYSYLLLGSSSLTICKFSAVAEGWLDVTKLVSSGFEDRSEDELARKLGQFFVWYGYYVKLPKSVRNFLISGNGIIGPAPVQKNKLQNKKCIQYDGSVE
jgi:hypothetical protein